VSHANEELRSFEEPGSYPAVELPAWPVEVSQSPVGNSHLLLAVVNKHVVRLNVAVDDAPLVAVVKTNQDLKQIPLNVL
jgi:hypothetical protein